MRYTQLGILWLAITIIFIADTLMTLEIAVAMFYAPLLLLASGILERRGFIALSSLCCLLTIVSFMLTTAGAWHAGLVNTGLSLVTLLLTTWQVRVMQAARAAAHNMQAQLQRIARARQLEGLAGSIAHEINQPLAAISASADAALRWLAHQPPTADKANQTLMRIQKDAQRASQIIARVRNLTKGGPVQRSAFDFNAALQEIIDQCAAELQRHAIQCHTDLAAALPPAWADRIQIQQVMSNGLLNAIEAVTSPSSHTRQIHIQTRLQGGMLAARIGDSGPGIPEDARAHLFEAFWSSKEQGMGVGLSISRAMIEANGGHITLEPQPQGGALFQVCVPTQESTA